MSHLDGIAEAISSKWENMVYQALDIKNKKGREYPGLFISHVLKA
jgi:hypothetical protein